MRISKQSATTNPAGGLKIIEGVPSKDYKRDDAFRRSNTAAKKPNYPSRPDSEKR